MKNKIILFVFIFIIIISLFVNSFAVTETIDLTLDFSNNTDIISYGFNSSYVITTFNNDHSVNDISSYTDMVVVYSDPYLEVDFFNPNTTYYEFINDFSFYAKPKTGNSLTYLEVNLGLDQLSSLQSTQFKRDIYSSYSLFTDFVPYDNNGNELNFGGSSANFSINDNTIYSTGSIISSGSGGSDSGSGGNNNNNNNVSNDVNNNTVSNDINSNVVSNSVVIDYSDILGRIDNTTQSTNSIVNGIDTSILEMQNTLNDSWNTQDNIDNNVNEIKSILQSQNNQEVINEIQSSSNTTQSYIQEQTNQSATQFNTITDTNNYNQNSVSIDTSWNDISDVNGVDNFINQVTQLLYNYFYGLSNDVAITASFPMPYNQGQVNVSTESITRFYNNNPGISYLTTMFWYVVFGLYIFRLAYTLWISSVDGTIFRDTEGIVARIDDNNIIKYFML